MTRHPGFTVTRHENRGHPVYSVMRGSIVILRYVDEDTAYAVADMLTVRTTSEYAGTVYSTFMDS